MNSLFDFIPVFPGGALVGAHLDVAVVSETSYGIVPFITPFCIKFSFFLWYFVKNVLCYANIFLLLCLVINLLFDSLSTFSMILEV